MGGRLSDQSYALDHLSHFAAIVDCSHDAIISKDLNGYIQSWNKAAERMFGYTADEMIGQSILLLFPPDRRDEEPRILERILRGERVDHYETVRRRKDGHLVDVSITVSPLMDAQGHVVGASSIARGITLQKLSQHRDQQLFRLATAVNQAEALPALYEHALEAITASLGTERASILLFDPDGVMRFKASRGLSQAYRTAVEGHSPWKPDELAPTPVIIADTEKANLPTHLKAVIDKEGIKALAFIPLTYGRRLIGKFMVYFGQARTMDSGEVQLAQSLGHTLALGIERTRSEEQLRQSERQLRAALTAGRMGSWEWEVSSNKVYWSPELEALHGLAPGTFDGSFESFQRDIHPDDRERVLNSIMKTVQEGTPHHIEYRILLSEGTVEWVEGKGTLFRSDEGMPTKMIGVCSNITERKQAEEALQAKENWLRLAQSVGKVGIFQWDLVTRRTQCSEQFFKVVGMQPASDVGFEQWYAQTHPDDRDRVLDEVQRAVETVGSCGSEYRIIGTDRNVRWISYRAQAFTGNTGNVTHILGTVQDVTDLKLAQERQTTLASRLKRITDSGIIGILYWDMNGRIFEANDTFLSMIGYSRTDIEAGNLNWKTLTPPEWTAMDAAKASLISQHGTLEPFEKEFSHKNGSRVPILLSATTLEEAPGTGVSLVLDISGRKKTEADLRVLTEELETRVQVRTRELLQTHEQLRSLASELNLAEQRERKRLAAELHDHLQQTLVLGKFKVGQAKRMLQTLPECLEIVKQLDDMLTEALTYTRTLVAELSPLVLRDHGLPAGLKWLAEYMKKHEMTVKVKVQNGVTFKLPEDQAVLLFQSVRELLINAAKHAQTDQASVMLQQHEDYLTIQVHDEGRGFDVSAQLAPSEQSSKFGLFSIKERMRALGGAFEISSKPGAGTTAILSLPFAFPAEIGNGLHNGERNTNGLTTSTSATSIIQLLLVDDHAMMRQGLKTMLSNYPDITLIGEAKDGEEAIRLAAELRPQVVVMDINMPKLNGIEATARIKKLHPEICVIGLSVNAEQDNQDAMKRAGAALLITKEAAVDELYHAVRAGLGLPSSSLTV